MSKYKSIRIPYRKWHELGVENLPILPLNSYINYKFPNNPVVYTYKVRGLGWTEDGTLCYSNGKDNFLLPLDYSIENSPKNLFIVAVRTPEEKIKGPFFKQFEEIKEAENYLKNSKESLYFSGFSKDNDTIEGFVQKGSGRILISNPSGLTNDFDNISRKIRKCVIYEYKEEENDLLKKLEKDKKEIIPVEDCLNNLEELNFLSKNTDEFFIKYFSGSFVLKHYFSNLEMTFHLSETELGLKILYYDTPKAIYEIPFVDIEKVVSSCQEFSEYNKYKAFFKEDRFPYFLGQPIFIYKGIELNIKDLIKKDLLESLDYSDKLFLLTKMIEKQGFEKAIICGIGPEGYSIVTESGKSLKVQYDSIFKEITSSDIKNKLEEILQKDKSDNFERSFVK